MSIPCRTHPFPSACNLAPCFISSELISKSSSMREPTSAGEIDDLGVAGFAAVGVCCCGVLC
jgi:hypothetical protein